MKQFIKWALIFIALLAFARFINYVDNRNQIIRENVINNCDGVPYVTDNDVYCYDKVQYPEMYQAYIQHD